MASEPSDNEWVSEEYPPELDAPELIQTPTLHPKRRKRTKNGTTPNRILSQEHSRRALEMRKTGMSYEFIGQTLGLSTSGARAAVIRAMDRIITEPAHELRLVTYERLNHMLLAIWPQVHAGERGAISEARAIMNDILRLFGADSPQKVQVEGQIEHSGAVAVVEIDEKDFIAEMQKMVFQAQHTPHQLGPITHSEQITFGGGDDEEYDDDEVIVPEVIEHRPIKPPMSMAIKPKEE